MSTGRRCAVLLSALLLALLTGCATTSSHLYSTPASPAMQLEAAYPVAVDYTLLGLTSGKACEKLETLKKNPIPGGGAQEPGTGHPLVYQAAKYNALEKIPDADNLVSIRTRVEQTDTEQCVTVTGRAYRIASVKATPAPVVAATTTVPAGFSPRMPFTASRTPSASATKAAPDTRKPGVGLGLGLEVGPELELLVRGRKAVAWELGMGIATDTGDDWFRLKLAGLYESPSFLPGGPITLRARAGAGIYSLLGSTDNSGVNLVVGLAAGLRRVPLELAWDLRPGLTFDGEGAMRFSSSLRWYF